MRRPLPPLLAALLLACSITPATAATQHGDHNRYKWRDAAGNLHYADVLPPEAARLGYEVVSPQGVVVRRVERAKTADELALAKAAAAQAQTEKDAQDRRDRTDAQLVNAYPTEADLQRAQRQQLEMFDQQLNAARISLRSQEQTLADMLARAADVERDGETLSAVQAKQLADMRHQVDEQRLLVTRRENEREQAINGFVSQTERYRKLRDKTPSPPES